MTGGRVTLGAGGCGRWSPLVTSWGSAQQLSWAAGTSPHQQSVSTRHGEHNLHRDRDPAAQHQDSGEAAQHQAQETQVLEEDSQSNVIFSQPVFSVLFLLGVIIVLG